MHNSLVFIPSVVDLQVYRSNRRNRYLNLFPIPLGHTQEESVAANEDLKHENEAAVCASHPNRNERGVGLALYGSAVSAVEPAKRISSQQGM